MGEGSDSGMDRNSLSSISTILGLSLFCFLVVTIIVRRCMIHRQNRRFARERLWAATAVIGGRRRSDPEDDEPRTIAIGARASLMRRPVIWESRLDTPNRLYSEEKRVCGSCWDHLQPTALQLLSPHTTAHFPKHSPSRNPHGPSNRITRAYSHFLFHRDHMVPSTTPNADPSGSILRRQSGDRRTSRSPRCTSGSTPPNDEPEKLEVEDGTHPHPVHLTFLITMPDSSSPLYHSHPHPQTSSQLTVLTPFALGTTQPTARLPSIRISSTELDSWWDLPPSSPAIVGMGTSGLTAGQILQLEIQRERMEREGHRMRIMHDGFSGPVMRR